ncbi:MAG: HAD family hydrolase [Gemmatimonadota bacterium]
MEHPTAAGLLILFDVDGTLLLTDGAGRVAIRAALEAVYGTSGPMEGYNFHGKTDPQIVVELMSGAGLDEREIRDRLTRVWPIYLRTLESELEIRRAEGRITVLPGVAELLAVLEGRTGISLGLLTGNIEEGARLKLAAADVPWRFDVGAYGSDSEERSEIARIAVERGRSSVGAGDAPASVVVVGDTPEDIACARAVNARAIAVATGRHGVGELEEAGADAVFGDFRDTEAVLQCIGSLSGTANGRSDSRGNGGSR